ncbi:MAG: transporter [Pseudomonadota bacterium]
MHINRLPIVLVGALMTSSALAHDLPRADAHAPIGVSGDHFHKAGEWMFSYRYKTMNMDQIYNGSGELSSDDVLGFGYNTAPEEMDMEMHMIGGMYAPTDRITLMAMVPHVTKTMSARSSQMTQNLMNARAAFETETRGIGDMKIGGLYVLHSQEGKNLLLNAMVSLPTGTIDEEGLMANPMMGERQLAYPMQLGSGTVDLMPGLTYTAAYEGYSWGSQVKATLRTGENDNGYTLGDRQALTTWIAKPLGNSWSVSARLAYEHWDNIDGSDEDLQADPATSLAADTGRKAGEHTQALLGINYIFKGLNEKGNQRLAIEVGDTFAHDLDGPQMGTAQLLTLGYQVAF